MKSWRVEERKCWVDGASRWDNPLRKPSSSFLLSLAVSVQLPNQQEEGGKSPLMDYMQNRDYIFRFGRDDVSHEIVNDRLMEGLKRITMLHVSFRTVKKKMKECIRNPNRQETWKRQNTLNLMKTTRFIKYTLVD